MSRRDGMPIPYHEKMLCPFCKWPLYVEKRMGDILVWSHWINDPDYPLEPCPNNASLFVTREPGTSFERLEPIV